VPRALLIDPDTMSISRLRQALEEAQFEIEIAADALQGLRRIYEQVPDLVIMAYAPPLINGKELCSRIRQVSEIPIMVLGQRDPGSLSSILLESGADTYLPRSVGSLEFMAWVHALLRRSTGRQRTCLEPGGQGTGPRLTPTECRLLNCLVLNTGRVVTTSQLVTEVWGGKRVSPDSPKFYIRRLRQKLGGELILNDWGVGYRFSVEQGVAMN
jgi:DNA-binding response OmpR family regulator